jgi:hypothetical protein
MDVPGYVYHFSAADYYVIAYLIAGKFIAAKCRQARQVTPGPSRNDCLEMDGAINGALMVAAAGFTGNKI